jgi:glycosyltransferase involved in cell wall biosynthesis
MRIAHLLAPAMTGGLESVVRMLALGQVDRGHAVSAIAVLDHQTRGASLLSDLRAHNVDVIELNLPARAYLAEARAQRRALRRLRPDIAHTHGYRSDVIGGFVSRRLRIPTVSTVHGFTGGDWKNRMYEQLQLRALRRFDAVVAVSRPMAERLERGGVKARQLRILPNAFAPDTTALSRNDARRMLGLPEDAFIVGWVGRMSAEKGGDVMLESLALLRDLPIRVSMVGDGPERGKLENLATALQVEGQITWHGVVPGAGRLVGAFDLFVLSSRTEGTPIALLEAISVGTPVVTTAVGGVPDVVTSEQAILVPPESPAKLAEAIRQSWALPAAAAQRARLASQRLVVAFSVDPWLARYEEIYRAVAPSALAGV